MATINRRPERGIVAAACQIDGLTFSMPAPARHGDVLFSMSALGIKCGKETQGFLDHRGVFVGRKAAKITALSWGQITQDEFDDGLDLFSEHLW